MTSRIVQDEDIKARIKRLRQEMGFEDESGRPTYEPMPSQVKFQTPRIATQFEQSDPVIKGIVSEAPKPFMVTSARRDPALNASVRGAVNSKHLSGEALDLGLDTDPEVINHFRKNGFWIHPEPEKNHIHVERRGPSSKKTIQDEETKARIKRLRQEKGYEATDPPQSQAPTTATPQTVEPPKESLWDKTVKLFTPQGPPVENVTDTSSPGAGPVLRTRREFEEFQKFRDLAKKEETAKDRAIEIYNRVYGHAGVVPQTEVEREDFAKAEAKARDELGLGAKPYLDKLKDKWDEAMGPDLNRFGQPKSGPVSDWLDIKSQEKKIENDEFWEDSSAPKPLQTLVRAVSSEGLLQGAKGAHNLLRGLVTPENAALGGVGGFSSAAGKAIGAAFVPTMAKGAYEKGKEAIENFTGENPIQGIAPLVESLGMGLGAAGGVHSGLSLLKGKTAVTPEATIPETPQTLNVQLEALQKGNTPAMLVTPGEQMPPTIPGRFKTAQTDVGTWIYDPLKMSKRTIEQKVADGTHGEILGFVEPKSQTTTQAVTATTPEGVEAKTAAVSPENVPAQAAELQRQFPEAKIEVKAPEEILQSRRNPSAQSVDAYFGSGLGGLQQFLEKDPAVAAREKLLSQIEQHAKKTGKKLVEASDDLQVAFDPELYAQIMERQREMARSSRSFKALDDIEEFYKDAKRKLIDSNAPIEDLLRTAQKKGKFEILPEYNYSDQVDMVLRAPTLAGQFAEDGGLTRVVRDVDKIQNLDQYLIAKQALDVSKKGIETGRDLVKDQKLVEAFAPKYEPYAQTVTAYSRKLLDYAMDAGLVSKELAQALKERYPNYVPLNRVFEEVEAATGYSGGKGVASLSKQTVVQKLEGSKREIEPPVKSLLERTHDAFMQGEKNKAGKILAGMKDLPGNPLQLEPLRTAENVKKRISLYEEAADLKPLQVATENVLLTNGRLVKELQSQINKFEKEGLYKSLKQKPIEPIPKLQSGVIEKVKKGEIKLETKYALLKKRGEQSAKKFIEELITEPSADIKNLKSKVATRENKLGPLLDDIQYLKEGYDAIVKQRRTLFDEAKLLKDAKSKGKDIITFLNDGIKEVWETSPEVAASAKALNVQQLNVLGKILAAPVRAAKLGITGYNIPFITLNLLRDQPTAFINSRYGLKTSILNPAVFVRALFEAVRHGELYKEAVREGALGTSYDIYRDQVPLTLDRIRSKKNLPSRIKYTIRHPSELIRAIENIVGRSEEVARLQLYIGTKEASLKEGRRLKDARRLGARSAREDTANFYRRGEWGNALGSAFLYLNASKEGSRAFIRGFSRAPVATTAKIVTALYFPVAISTLLNLKDPKTAEAYKDIYEHEKDNNLIYIPPNPTKDAKGKWNVIKIPLPPGVADLAIPIRRLIEQVHGLDPLRMGEVANALIGSVSPVKPTLNSLASTFTPQIIKPELEAYTNKNFFTGSPIVPGNLEKLSPELQVKPNTSGTARFIGNKLGVSPLQVEHFVRGVAGGVGTQILNAVDRGLYASGKIPKEQIGGQSISEGLVSRFTKASGGKTERDEWSEINKYQQSADDQRFLLKNKAKDFVEWAIKNPDAANEKIKQIETEDPKLYEKIADLVEEKQKGLTAQETRVKSLPVEQRAQYILDKMKQMPPEAREPYYKELVEKKIVTEKVEDAIQTYLTRRTGTTIGANP